MQSADFLRRWLAELAPSPAKQALARRGGAGGEGRSRRRGERAAGAAGRSRGRQRRRGRARGAVAGRRARRRRGGGARRRRSAQPAGGRGGGRRGAGSRSRATRRRSEGATPRRRRWRAIGNDLEARFALASAHAAALEWEPALAELLELVKRNRKFRDDGARRAMLVIFDHLRRAASARVGVPATASDRHLMAAPSGTDPKLADGTDPKLAALIASVRRRCKPGLWSQA